jgi:hypothetical protein
MKSYEKQKVISNSIKIKYFYFMNSKQILSILFFILLTTNSVIYGQTKRVTISEAKIGGIDCQHKKTINLDKGDTSYYVIFGFQNAEYQTLIDIVAIGFHAEDSAEIKEFSKSLKSAYNQMGSKSTITWSKSKYRITLYDFSPNLYLMQPIEKGNGYIIISKENVLLLINWIESIGYKN